MSILFGLFGLACLIGIAWLFSNNAARSTGSWCSPASPCRSASPWW
jgi:hypothetical protein